MNKKKKEVDNTEERALKQHSALTTFTTEQEYFNIDTEKALFSILSDVQSELQSLFAEIYTPYIEKLFKDEDTREKLLKAIYVTNSVSNIDIDYSKINTKEIPSISKEIIKKKIDMAHSALTDKSKKEKYLLEIEGIDIKQITMNEQNNNNLKIAYTREELVDLLDNIKDICKYETLNRYGRSKFIDFTTFTNKIGVNSKRLKDNLEKASKVQLRFNYIDKKNLHIESVSNLISSIAFIRNRKSTWMKYEIPEEILKHILMPDIYVYLQEKKIHKLEGKYSIRLYSFLKDHSLFGEVTITKEECKNFFKIPKSYLSSKSRFIDKFLNPTIADIQAKTLLMIDYELIPTYNFQKIKFKFKQGKEEVKTKNSQEQNTLDVFKNINISEELQKVISKAKHNIYVSRAWNKRMDTKIIKMLKEDGEDFTIEILKSLYESLNTNIQTTLVQYVNGMIKNKKLNQSYNEEKKKKEIQKELEEDVLIPEIVKNNDEIELQKVTSLEEKKFSDALSEYQIEQIELQKVTSLEQDEERLYDICIKENRLKPQGKFVITSDEYMKEHKRYISEGYTPIKATEMMMKLFIVKRSEEE